MGAGSHRTRGADLASINAAPGALARVAEINGAAPRSANGGRSNAASYNRANSTLGDSEDGVDSIVRPVAYADVVFAGADVSAGEEARGLRAAEGVRQAEVPRHVAARRRLLAEVGLQHAVFALVRLTVGACDGLAVLNPLAVFIAVGGDGLDRTNWRGDTWRQEAPGLGTTVGEGQAEIPGSLITTACRRLLAEVVYRKAVVACELLAAGDLNRLTVGVGLAVLTSASRLADWHSGHLGDSAGAVSRDRN